jgi:hypothetical protein
MGTEPPRELLDRVARLLDSVPAAWQSRAGGWTTNERWSLDLADGRRVFAKMAPNAFMGDFLRQEHANMSTFDADFRCEIIAWDDDPEQPLLLLEDLRDARWPPPWEPDDIERVRATLERVWALPTDGLPVGDRFAEMFSGWQRIADEPDGFLSLGIASRAWFDTCIDR